MTPARRAELETDMNAKLTEEELKEGWRFCACEWDGLLIRAGDVEATYCGCFYDEKGNLK